jgi:hypothetical protein
MENYQVRNVHIPRSINTILKIDYSPYQHQEMRYYCLNVGTTTFAGRTTISDGGFVY